MSKSRLEDALLALFLRAEAEGRRDTAEHLMRAMEAFYANPGATLVSPQAGDGLGASAEQRRSLEPKEKPPHQSDAAGQGGPPIE